MKLKIFLSAVLILVSINLCFGQSESRMVDEFGKSTNDELQARILHFIKNLDKNNSHGLIVLYDEKEKSLSRYLNARRIEGCFSWIKYDASNISFAFAERAKTKDDYLFQFWEVPPNAQKPQFKTIPHDYKLDDLTEPTIIYANDIGGEYCPLYFDMKFYANFLRANPNIVGKIVIYENSFKNYNEERLKYLRELSRKEKISPKQIKVTQVKSASETDDGISYTEFWLVPKKTETARRLRN